MSQESEITQLETEALIERMQDDLYDGLADEVVAGVQELLRREMTPYDILTRGAGGEDGHRRCRLPGRGAICAGSADGGQSHEGRDGAPAATAGRDRRPANRDDGDRHGQGRYPRHR